jgi:hypothetical protein
MYSDETVYIAMICMAIGGTIIGLTYGLLLSVSTHFPPALPIPQ